MLKTKKTPVTYMSIFAIDGRLRETTFESDLH